MLNILKNIYNKFSLDKLSRNKTFTWFILLFISHSLFSQENLITNGSFEEISQCYGQPANLGFDVFQWSDCKGWSNPIKSSSDLWCQNPIFGNIEPPNISLGYQEVRSGNNMAGILMNDGIIISYREYIQNELISPLVKDMYYKLKFYHSPVKTDCSTNQFGIILLEQKLFDLNLINLSNYLPDGKSNLNEFEGDTSRWNLCEIIFKAHGDENYLVLGNFQDSTNSNYALPCDTSYWGNISYAGNYFFIDDVSLEILPSTLEIPNVFSPNNDNVNDVFYPTIVNYPNWKMTILNRWGNLITELNENIPFWDGINITDGVYFYKFECEELNENKQGFISIIR